MHGAEEAAVDFVKDPAHFFEHAIEKLHRKRLIKNEQQFGATTAKMNELGFKGINIAALLACVGEEDKAALMVDAAVQSFEDAYKTKNIEEAVGGAIALYAAYQQAV